MIYFEKCVNLARSKKNYINKILKITIKCMLLKNVVFLLTRYYFKRGM